MPNCAALMPPDQNCHRAVIRDYGGPNRRPAVAVSMSHLRSFWAVAGCGGFTAAARMLRISQPTLTRQIKDLEEGYGLLLFERSPKGLTLSPEGQILLPIVNRIFDQVQEAESFLKRHKREEVRLAAVTTEVTTRMISAIQSADPGLTLTLSVGTSAAVYEALQTRTCDIGILTLPDDAANLSTLQIGSYPLLALLPDDHPLAAEETLSIKDLSTEPLITGSHSSQARRHLDRAAAAADVSLGIAQEIDAYEMIGELVRLGLGVGVIGYTGIVERHLRNVKPIRECTAVIPVHFACLAINRRIRVIENLFNVAEMAVVEGRTAPFTFARGRTGS